MPPLPIYVAKEESMSANELKPRATNEQPLLIEAAEETDIEVDLVELFYSLLENAKYIVLATLIGALLFGLYSYLIAVPQYESTAKLYVLNSNDSVLNLSDLQVGSYLASDYLEVFKTWEVNERVLMNLNLNYTYREMQEMLTLSNPSNTRILYITVTSPRPEEASLLANEYAKVARQYIAETMNTEAPNVLSTALMPTIPVSPNKTRNIIWGGLIGALIAIAVVVIRVLMDEKIRTTDDILKYAGLPTMAIVPLSSPEFLNWQKKKKRG